MELLKESDYKKELKTGLRSGYLFFCEEDYLKSFALRQTREVLSPDPTLAFFNEMRIDALEYTPQRLLDALTPLPMMADKKLITLSGLNFNTMHTNELEDLCEVLGELKVYDYNVLIVYASADCLEPGYLPQKPSPPLKALGEHLTPVQFPRCTTSKLVTWIQRHFNHNGVEASPTLCSQMAEYCGHSMYVLANEIDKLSYYLLYHGKKEATWELTEQICTPANEFDAFALTNAVMANRQDTALSILSDYKFRRVDPLVIFGEVTRTICDMIGVQTMTAQGASVPEIMAALNLRSEYKVELYQRSLRQAKPERLKRALEACTTADAHLKLSPKGYTELEKLICVM